jgi:hypothetical protein
MDKLGMEVLTFLVTIDGATEKVLQIILPLMSIYNKNFGFIVKNVLLNPTEKLKLQNTI